VNTPTQNKNAAEVAPSTASVKIHDSLLSYATFADRARLLTDRQIAVVPVDPLAKRCTLPEWPKLATTNEQQIQAWAVNSSYNTAAVAKHEGICILDCDTLGLPERIESETGQEIPATFQVCSAGKRAPHLYFLNTDRSRSLGNCSASGMFDFQQNNKYVVGPGSVIQVNGELRSYDIVNDALIVPIPDWLCDWLQKNGVAEKPVGAGVPVHPDFDIFAFLEHYGFDSDVEGNWYITDVCPIAGHKHEQSTNTGFYFDGEHFGFHCFASGCPGSEMSVGDVIKFLNRPEGLKLRKPYPGVIWKEMAEQKKPQPKLRLVTFEEIQSKPVEWHWPGRTARGHLTTFNGDPGTNKSFASLDIAARITTGRPWPDGSANPLAPSPVLALTREDGNEDTVKPRFLAAGGNPKFLTTILADGSDETAILKLEDCLEELAAVMKPDTRLIIFDPLIDFMRAGSNNESEVRDVLTKLKQFAQQRDLSVIGINHLNKKTDIDAIHRTMGAKGFIGVARMNYLFGKDEVGGRHMVPLKNNLWPDDGSLMFQVENTDIRDGHITISNIGRLVWMGKGKATADDLTQTKRKATINPVVEWLKEFMMPVGTRKLSKEIHAAGKDLGFSKDQIKNGLGKIGAQNERTKTVPSEIVWFVPPVGW
jgi:hypothetical protein